MPIVVYHLKRNIKQLIPTMKLYKDIKETIEEMTSKGIVVGILTSNSQEVVQTFLKNNDISGFQFIFTGSGIFGKAKNLKIIKAQLTSKTIFYVGDEVRDVKAAKEANVKSIAATWGFHSRKLLESSDPEAIADRPSDLINIILK
jgi:phosphoglycolate phosphatase